MAKIVFFSASGRALAILEALQEKFEVVGVVSQPDRPVGREGRLESTAISVYAQKQGFPLLKPEKLDAEAIRWIAGRKPDVLVSTYYGLLIPSELLNITPHGVLNIHPSLLPKYRGPSPVQAAVISGDKKTGVTIIKMDEQFDHGPIISQFQEPIQDNDNQETLYTRLFEKAAAVLVEILPAYLTGKIELREQDHEKATFTTLVKKEHGFIPPKFIQAALKGVPLRNQKWSVPFIRDSSLVPNSSILERFVRAMDPWPGAWSQVQLAAGSKQQEARRIKILKAHVEEGKLVPDEVQLEGKNPVTFAQFKQGYPQGRFM